jgi:hypothetical protein
MKTTPVPTIAKRSQRRLARLCLRPEGAGLGASVDTGSTVARALRVGTSGGFADGLAMRTFGESFDPRNGAGVGFGFGFFFTCCFFTGTRARLLVGGLAERRGYTVVRSRTGGAGRVTALTGVRFAAEARCEAAVGFGAGAAFSTGAGAGAFLRWTGGGSGFRFGDEVDGGEGTVATGPGAIAGGGTVGVGSEGGGSDGGGSAASAWEQATPAATTHAISAHRRRTEAIGVTSSSSSRRVEG